MRVIIAGGRDFFPLIKHTQWLEKSLKTLQATEIVSGCASGADKFGEDTATKLRLPIKKFPANWKEFGKSAGPIRNQQMAEYANACILFPGGSGTADMKRRALHHNLIVIEYEDLDENL